MSTSEVGTAKPRVLLLYYTYTKQALRVAEAIGETLRGRGCDVTLAGIEFTDKRYMDRFTRFPLRHAYLDIFGMLPAQLRRATGEIKVPDEARQGDYDLVCIGSPTWWLTTCMPIRSFLKSDDAGKLLEGKPFAGYVVCRRYWRNNLSTVKKLGSGHGGRWIDGIHFAYAGGQVRSLLSLISYLGKGENRDHYLAVPIPPTNLAPDFGEQAETFANRLADSLEAGMPNPKGRAPA